MILMEDKTYMKLNVKQPIRTKEYWVSDADVGCLLPLAGTDKVYLPSDIEAPEIMVGDYITFYQMSSKHRTEFLSKTSIIKFTPGNKTRSKNSVVTLIKVDSDTWLATGDLTI